MIDIRVDHQPRPDATDSGVTMVTVVTVVGEVDLDTSAQMAAALDGCVGPLTVDLEGVTFMDSSGLGTLIRARNRVGADSGQLSVTGVSQNVRRLFKVTGLADFLTG